MKKCVIKTSCGRDYYTVGVLDSYWGSIKKHLGDTVELITSESVGNKFKRLVFTVEVLNIKKFEKYIKKSTFDNWTFTRNYSMKAIRKAERKAKAQAKVDKLKDELDDAEKSLKLF